jgi:hypothetical protein
MTLLIDFLGCAKDPISLLFFTTFTFLNSRWLMPTRAAAIATNKPLAHFALAREMTFEDF